ncbi:MAG: alpha-L-fucosidase [Planctomycetaceae bacterium]|nr:alpha-L-fucosidase [Planctomycetaceae bacterium]
MATGDKIVDDSLKLPVEKLQWWRDAKFGMFLHWGLYSILGRGEWAMFHERIDKDEYAKLAGQFNPRKFDPAAWAAAAKNAGMKYMVLTARHHDGFSLFDTQAGDFNSVKTAAGRDFIAAYVQACREAGLGVGIYYSPMDWRFPGYFFPTMYRASAEAMKQQCYTQVRELMSNYGKIDVLWYDGGWLAHGGWNTGKPPEDDSDAAWLWEPLKLNRMVRDLQPDVVINPRSGWEGDYATFECHEGQFDNSRPWERCDTLTGSWGYRPGWDMRTLRGVIHLLAGTAGRGGNLLLNLDPGPDGDIEQRKVDRLAEVGRFLQQAGDSIYATMGGPYAPAGWGCATCKGNRIYLHILDWPENTLTLPAPKHKITAATSLTAASVDVSTAGDTLRVTVSERDRLSPDTVVAIDLDGPALTAV